MSFSGISLYSIISFAGLFSSFYISLARSAAFSAAVFGFFYGGGGGTTTGMGAMGMGPTGSHTTGGTTMQGAMQSQGSSSFNNNMGITLG